MDRRQFHKFRFRKSGTLRLLPPLTADQANYEVSSNYQIKESKVEKLTVLPTGCFFDPITKKDKDGLVDSWLSDPTDQTVLYVFAKEVNTKKPVYSAIASSGELNLKIGDRFELMHDQRPGQRICFATLHMLITNAELRDPATTFAGYNKMSFMVFK